MGVTTSNLIMGPGTLYDAPFGTAEPVAFAAPAVAWRDVGGTQDGVTMSVSQEFAEIEVDQIPETPERRMTKREMTIATNLAEATLDNLANAINEEASSIVSGTGIKTFEPLNGLASFTPKYRASLFEGPGPGGFPRRVIARKTLSTEGTEFAYSKDGQNVFSITRTTHFVSDSIKPFAVIDKTA